ncbi:dioxygenase family protein [Roseateles koreensis]|uniref:Intradiol ring-cleavage dioxygenase n=1 Tax=Roseateles koreensis TaxID=2987526 RepID=A0ABT5KPA5_9BURK|nr:intradiol ring-cleavage dioxygenase [Roseateles koreensis]MDC8784734.1 intradiol ring-cleavage dioxygenase [Roseateles koreensis]
MSTQHNSGPDQHPGLPQDLQNIQLQSQRRRMTLAWLAGAGVGGGAMTLLGCGGGGSSASSAAGTGTSTGTGTGTSTGSGSSSCTVIAQETSGPYPGDGSNSVNGSVVNALALSGIVRSDIRSSIAGVTGTASGVPMTVTIQLVNTQNSCADLAGYAIYLWHCDAGGNYSLYSSGAILQNYLRGVQISGSDGKVTFTTIVPGCYSGRMPHMHFEVYPSAAAATRAGNAIATSQIAFPTDICTTVYSSATGYSGSSQNLASMSFATDGVFSDGTSTEMATVTGSVAAGYAASLTVGIAA